MKSMRLRASSSQRGCTGQPPHVDSQLKRQARKPFGRAQHKPCRHSLITVCASNDDDKPGQPEGSSQSPSSVPPPEPDDPEASSPSGASLQISRDVIQRMKDAVFSFDAFFVTETENYEANGVLFRGNLRGDPAAAYEKMQRRLRSEFGDKYAVFLLQDQKEKPVVTLLPAEAAVPPDNRASLPLAAVFAALTFVTTLGASGVPILAAVATGDTSGLTSEAVVRALPGTAATFALLAAHEAGHLAAAKRLGVKLAPPFLIPAGLGIIGSFGTITGVRGVLPNRTALLRIGEAGPAAGAAASGVLTLVGLGLSLAGVGPLTPVEASAFNDCILLGALGQLAFGGRLLTDATIDLSPVLLAGWAGLVINGLSAIPMGELDGGRIAHGIWGRRAASRINVVVTLVLGLAGIIDSLALYWFLLVLSLQRGPVLPQSEELSAPEGATLGLAILALPLLTLLPYPGDVTSAGF